jgi:predicted dehydrogenase
MIEQGAQVSMLCDLHPERLQEAFQFLQNAQTKMPEKVTDRRKVYDSKDVDAVIVATPDHWHALATIEACQAGKDVYVEKPHSHNIYESRKMIQAAHKYDRVVQVGTQNRSAPYNLAALDYVRSGKLGKIGLVKVYNLKSGKAFHFGESDPKPHGFDWNTWLGPAKERPYHYRIFRYGWHKLWDFSGGDLADDGIHQLDLALMLMQNPGVPSSVACSGGRLIYNGDDAEVPDVQIVTYNFDSFFMTMEMTNYPRYMQKTTGTIRRNDILPYWTQNATRIELYGSDLMMTVGRHGGGWQVTTSGGKVVDQMFGRPPDYDHYRNFFKCIDTRQQPNAFVETAHPACLAIHMANIAHRIGNQTLFFDSKKETFLDQPKANGLLKRDYRNAFQVPERI